VSVVARQYDVSSNQVFSWRRRYMAVQPPPAAPPSAGLVPVTITPEAESMTPPPTLAAPEPIEIEVGGDCRVRVGASFDARALKRVLDVLSQAEGVRKKSR
jgi:transposase